MTNFSAKELISSYLNWYSDKVKFSDIEENVVRIDTPFKDASMDNLIIYAVYTPQNNNIQLTDDGYTMFHLENNGVYFKNSKLRLKLLEEQISAYGIKFNNNTKEFYVNTSYEKFSISKHRLLQCLIFISDMYLLSDHKIKNIFTEDVAQKLDDYNIAYNRDLTIVSSSGMSHTFDFVLNTKKDKKEKFINAISSPNNSMILKSKLTDAIYAKKVKRHRPNEFIFILNDLDKEIPKSSIDFIQEAGILSIKYSNFDREIKNIS
ncbi:DUF1828 domain-containing protein [Staphylococcus sp. HMSC036D05]|uniref:DUF1828 domain-containing protein n=1 Tax=Staphylococcus sp. HMSC036D05 TaxID=1715059 RepID=UPI0008AA55A8|nr:DUF1828 domain-containing protein [Staphylococcus sp. HMSC036D05]OHO72015.1 hypothetical protein HMPREF2580_08535 [Staphylococcus sp. HMSC036D05]